jgi:hypothetical protein
MRVDWLRINWAKKYLIAIVEIEKISTAREGDPGSCPFLIENFHLI